MNFMFNQGHLPLSEFDRENSNECYNFRIVLKELVLVKKIAIRLLWFSFLDSKHSCHRSKQNGIYHAAYKVMMALEHLWVLQMLIDRHMDIMPTSAKRVCREGSLETDKESSGDISPIQTPDLEAVRPKTRKHPESSLKSGKKIS